MKTNQYHRYFAGKPLALAVSLSISASPTLIAAQDSTAEVLPTIQVQADFRHTDIDQLAEAISVVNAQQIEARSADHLEAILSFAPNVNFAGGSSRARYFQIRGIGERSQFVEPVNPSVGLQIDGIDMTGLGGAATLFDVQQVEILRGPQGTRFGANALAGFINVDSKAPTKETEGYIKAKLGNYDSWGIGGAVSGSLADNLQARVAWNQTASDGFIENVRVNRDDTNNIDEQVLRAKLSWQPAADHNVDITLLRADIDNGYDAFTLDYDKQEARQTDSDQPGHDRQKTNAASIRWDGKVNTAVNIQLDLSGSNNKVDYGFDEDWSFDGLHPQGYNYFDQYLREFNRNTVDLRLLSGADGAIFNQTTDWVFGVYHANRDEKLTRNRTTKTQYVSDLDIRSIAAYGELNSELRNGTYLIYGLRYENWEYEFANSADIENSRSQDLWGGKIALEQLLNDDHLGYVSLARGYKPGGINNDPDVDDVYRTFDTETNNALEFGLKSSWRDDKLKTRLAIFYIQRKNQQVKASFNSRAPGEAPEFEEFLRNAAQGRNYGIELENRFELNDKLMVMSNIGYLKTQLKDFSFETEDGVVNQSGRAQAHAPSLSISSAMEYHFLPYLTGRLEGERKSSFFFSDSHNVKSRSYNLLHARLSYQRNQLGVALYGRNLTDQKHDVRGFLFGNDPRVDYENREYRQLAAPRTFGMDVSYKF